MLAVSGIELVILLALVVLPVIIGVFVVIGIVLLRTSRRGPDEWER